MIRITELAHQRVGEVVRPGDVVVDATVGNGRDTLFLSRCVGGTGTVYGFDIQAEALEQGRARVASEGGGGGKLVLIHDSHANLEQHVADSIRAVMFNLGYLPGGDRSITTQIESTLDAIRQAWTLLQPGGLISVVCYRGHPGGAEEAEAVWRCANKIPGCELETVGREECEDGPFLVLVRKPGAGSCKVAPEYAQ